MQKHKSAVVTIARHEETYIQEWIIFQYLTGFDKIVVWIHEVEGIPPCSTLDKIQQLPGHVLQKVDIKHIKKPQDINAQIIAYQSSCEELLGQVEWIALWDLDEYLYDQQKRPINQILDGVPKTTGQLFIPWLVFGPNNKILSATYPETRMSLFVKHSGDKRPTWGGYSSYGKAIARLDNIELPKLVRDIHILETSGDLTTVAGVHIEKDAEYPAPADVYLAHYYTGSMEDWVMRQKRLVTSWIQNYADYDYGGFEYHSHLCQTEDKAMLIYHNEVKEILIQC
jgi:hypothetical protein